MINDHRLIAWAAGFYEGEGTICYPKNGGLRMLISQKNLEPLVKFRGIVGFGAICREKKRDINLWYVYGYRKIKIIIEALWPYLSEQRKLQALKALEAWEMRRIQ